MKIKRVNKEISFRATAEIPADLINSRSVQYNEQERRFLNRIGEILDIIAKYHHRKVLSWELAYSLVSLGQLSISYLYTNGFITCEIEDKPILRKSHGASIKYSDSFPARFLYMSDKAIIAELRLMPLYNNENTLAKKEEIKKIEQEQEKLRQKACKQLEKDYPALKGVWTSKKTKKAVKVSTKNIKET